MKFKFINKIAFIGFIIFIILDQQLQAQSLDSIKVVKHGATLVRVSDQFTFTEGPAVDKKGNLFFTDQPNDKIWKYDIAGKLSLYMDKTGRSNGMYFDKKGNLITCADEKNELWSIDQNKKVTILLNSLKSRQYNGPNDLWISPKGDIYFTDPFYHRDYWTSKKSDIAKHNVFCLFHGKKNAIIMDSTLLQPNGIVGTPDGNYLYVADINDSKTYIYQINKNGQLINRQLFAPMGSDGMTLDQQGNLYLSGRGVTIYNAIGVKIGNIPVPSRWTANVCFGGIDRTTLFITATESVYTLQMQVKGVE